MADDDQEKPLCGAKRRPANGGGPCRLAAGYGTNHVGIGPCKFHMGCTPAVVASAMKEKARRAVETFGLSRTIDPRDALLEEVWRTAGAVDWIQRKIAELDADQLVWGVTEEKTGVNGEHQIYQRTESAELNIWVQLYQKERRHLVEVSKAAISAGIEERRVRIAEQQGQILGDAIRAILDDLELSPEQQLLVPRVVPARLRQLASAEVVL